MADLARIKQEFGRDLSFHGALDTQHLLPHGSPDEIRAAVDRTVEILGRGGGYIVAPAHCIQPDVPAQNVLAMADAVRALGSYP
jgi:uroporphyrinogen decarboxylase